MTEDTRKNGKKGNSAPFQIFIGILMILGFGVNFVNVVKEGNTLMMLVYGPLSIAGLAVVWQGIMKWRKNRAQT